MSLELGGVPILTRGDFSLLIGGLRDDAPDLGFLQAWLWGEPIEPMQLHTFLDITCRLCLREDEAGNLALHMIEVAIGRIETAFPESEA